MRIDKVLMVYIGNVVGSIDGMLFGGHEPIKYNTYRNFLMDLMENS